MSKKQSGKFYCQSVINHHFQTAEEREQWVQTNCPFTLTDEQREKLLKGEELEAYDEEHDILTTFALKEVK